LGNGKNRLWGLDFSWIAQETGSSEYDFKTDGWEISPYAVPGFVHTGVNEYRGV
jgi:hypothetical protein